MLAISLYDILTCDKCGSSIRRFQGGFECQSLVCRSKWPIIDDKFYYQISATKVLTSNSIRTELENANAWRKSNYCFYMSEFSNIQNYNVLDIGTGRGHFIDIFGRQNNLVCLDFLPYKDVDVVVNFENGLPIKSGIFDVVVLSNVLEHSFNISELLSETSRVLKSGGIVLGTVPFMTKVHQKPYDFHRPTNYALERFLAEAHFHSIEVYPLNSLFELFAQNVKTFFSLSALSNTKLDFKIIKRLFEFMIKVTTPIISRNSQLTSDFTIGFSFKATNGNPPLLD